MTPEAAAEAADAAEPHRGRAARWPWTIPPRGWKDIAWRAWNEAGRNRLGAVAGGVTFYLLLAAFPGLAAFVSVYGLFLDLGGVEKQLHQLARVFPREVVALLGQEMTRLAAQKHADLSVALVAGALGSVWSANAGMKALFDGLNVAFGETEKRPFFRRTLITYGATLGSLVMLVVVTGLTVAAPVVLHALGVGRIGAWFAWVRWLSVYLLAVVGFCLAYRVGPSRAAPHWRWLVVGGSGAALAWMGGSFLFSSYLDNFTQFGATYGSLGAVIGVMLWVWFTVMTLLWGAVVNAQIEHQTAQDTTIGPEAPMGCRGAVMADTLGEAFAVSPRELRDDLLRQARSLLPPWRRAAGGGEAEGG